MHASVDWSGSVFLYNCMGTRKISRLAALLLKRKQNNFNPRSNVIINTRIYNNIWEPEKRILSLNKGEVDYFMVKLTSKFQGTDRG